MTRTYLAVVLVVETAAIGLVSYYYDSLFLGLMLTPVFPITLFVALLAGRRTSNPAYWARKLSPQAIVGYRGRDEQALEPRDAVSLSRSIVERSGEIRRTLGERPSEVQVEMCALGYRACVNDMITLTNRITEESRDAGPVKRLKLRRLRRRTTDALSGAREALPPGALRATRQEL